MCPQREQQQSLSFLQQLATQFAEFGWQAGPLEQGFRDKVARMLGTMRTSVEASPWYQNGKNFAKEQPVVAAVLFAFGLAIGTPILCFLGFIALTVLIGIGSFVLIEGTLLTFALLILGGCLLFTAVFAGSIAVTTLAVFYVLQRLRGAVNHVVTTRLRPVVIGGQPQPQKPEELVHSD